MSISLPSFEAAFSQSQTYNLSSFQGQGDNFEAIRRTAADQDCRRRVATQIGAGDWRLTTLTRATGLNEEFDLGNTLASRCPIMKKTRRRLRRRAQSTEGWPRLDGRRDPLN